MIFCGVCRYYPSVFILKPGQTVHINKGRLHAFRKLSSTSLHETDCHHDLRRDIVQSLGNKDHLCISIAWDWMFKGVTSEGINREVSSILECARLNRRHSLQSLAIPETALLFLAKENTTKYLLTAEIGAASSLIALAQQSPECDNGFVPDAKTVLRGILPSLQYITHRHAFATKTSGLLEKRSNCAERISISLKPNTWENPDLFALDPYGNDFFCKLCFEELSNAYMHCDGCERLLSKDFNIW